jgi:diguanylate cyclase (GGDEF)-like protein
MTEGTTSAPAGGVALIAAAEMAFARALARTLEAGGMATLAVASAEEALELAAREKPRIVLIDADLPPDALALCRELRGEEATRRTPLFLITTSARLPEGAHAAGVTDFVSRPIDRELLLTRVRFQLAHAASGSLSPADAPRLQRLESAQALAGIGYWEWDAESDEVRLGPGAAGVLLVRDPLPTTLEELLAACVHPDDRSPFIEGLRAALAGDSASLGLLTRHPSSSVGPRFFKHFVSVSRGDDDSRIATVTVRDVSDERRAEENARRIAFYDGLTGLPNRRLFEKRLAAAVRRFGSQPESVALLFLDLNGFKQVNDRLGHSSGDALLREVGQRLLATIRPSDEVGRVGTFQGSVSRFGGDEFAVLLTGLRNAEHAAECAQRIHSQLARPIDLDGAEMHIGASIGIAVHPRDGRNTEALLHAADAAMYAAKADRSVPYCFFRADLDAAATLARTMLEQLAGAEQRGELALVYQPKFDLASGAITGAEALARWQSPLLGSVGPQDFIPVAEDSGLIVGLGRWVLEQACQQAASWTTLALTPPTVAVNVSRVQLLRGDFQRAVFDALVSSALEPKRLELEITESLMIEGENAIAPLRDLSNIGLTLALDDFGSGYSTLAALVRFPVQTLKLDRSLVRDIDTNPDAARVVRAVIRMAHELGRKVVAEGVDSSAQLRLLREAGCDEAQGFLLAKPMPPGDFRLLLERWKPRDALQRWQGGKD